MRLGIGDQVLADLRVDVVESASAGEGVKADGHAVGQFVLIARMDQDAHRGGPMIDAIKVAFDEGAEVPQAGVHFLERLGKVIRVLNGPLALRVIKPRTVEPGQVLVVSAGTVTPVDARGEPLIHLHDRVNDPLGGLRVLDGFA